MDEMLYNLGRGLFESHVQIWNGRVSTFNPHARRYRRGDLKRMAHQAGVDTALGA